jgi:hypothetical protein
MKMEFFLEQLGLVKMAKRRVIVRRGLAWFVCAVVDE